MYLEPLLASLLTNAAVGVVQVVERLAYILGSAHLHAAIPSCLSLLGCLSRAGVDAARAVWKCPGLPGLLLRHVRAARSDADANLSADAGYGKRWQAMRALCSICKWNPAAALDLRDAGMCHSLAQSLLAYHK